MTEYNIIIEKPVEIFKYEVFYYQKMDFDDANNNSRITIIFSASS